MGAFKSLLGRWGYAKLDDYGLVLSPEDRVIATRSTILDDGAGTPVVGWRDGDLAAAELGRWGEAKTQLQAPAPKAPAPPPAPVIRATPPPAPKPMRATPPPPPPKVETEDEWEWEIAMARARAAAEEVSVATPPEPAKTFWMTEEPLREKSWCEETPIRSVSKLAHLERLVSQHASDNDITKQTVIPVPRMPVVSNPLALKPVVRGSAANVPPPRRFARGTDQRLAQDGPTREERSVTMQLPVVGRQPARRTAR
jgi:hypothetical protein